MITGIITIEPVKLSGRSECREIGRQHGVDFVAPLDGALGPGCCGGMGGNGKRDAVYREVSPFDAHRLIEMPCQSPLPSVQDTCPLPDNFAAQLPLMTCVPHYVT